MRPAAILAAAALLASTASEAAPPTVVTDCGTYIGAAQTGTDSFLGVRFADPPTRFSPPQAPRCDPGAVFAATQQAPICIQDSQDPLPGSEDCLFLNIGRTASLNSSSLAPVLVFFHGGDLTIGATNWYDVATAAGAFADLGPVVIVFPAYRLNVLGYLATADLAAEQGGHTGNFGLADQLESLRWVQRNIASFGGDPSRVTISGQSSGGTSVYGLISGTGSRGLFHAAIAISASENLTFSADRKFAQDSGIVAASGCGGGSTPAERVACLRSLPAQGFADATPPLWDNSDVTELPSDPTGYHLPAIIYPDGLLVQQPLPSALRSGLVDVPLLVMHTAQELEMQPTWDVRGLTLAQWNASLASNFTPWGPGVGARVAAAYSFEASISPQLALSTIAGDFMTTCGMIGLAREALGEPGASRTTPLYALVGSWWPGAAGGYPAFAVGYSTKYSMHMWDLIAAFRSWDFTHRLTFGLQPIYTPTAADEAYGASTRAVWYALMRGVQPPGLERIDAAAGWPANYNVYVAGNATGGAGGGNVRNYRSQNCDLWTSLGMGPAFWWSN